jgi:hypothetical protein
MAGAATSPGVDVRGCAILGQGPLNLQDAPPIVPQSTVTLTVAAAVRDLPTIEPLDLGPGSPGSAALELKRGPQPVAVARCDEQQPRPRLSRLLATRQTGRRRTRDRGAAHRACSLARSNEQRADATRLAYVEVLPDEKAWTAIGFLRRAVEHFASYGIKTERLITDNGGAYCSAIHAIACRTLEIPHLRTRPYRPQTNGKAERYPHHAGRLGLRRDLPLKRRTQQRARWLARLLQSPPTTQRPQPQATHRSPPRTAQPSRVLHLGSIRGS